MYEKEMENKWLVYKYITNELKVYFGKNVMNTGCFIYSGHMVCGGGGGI